ncbi:MAG: GyrI-like domain-containing protein [Candidatus Marinimicrobia bacterium]|nr:GyrI-like domain-containing protein [Candidatus Neomarinimicrobiota bacterium]
MKQVLIIFMMILLLFACQRDLSEFDYLLEPQISQKPAQKMLVVEVKGDPNMVGKDAFGQLFKTFFAIKRDYKDLKVKPPRARWPLSVDILTDEWIGVYALPLSDFVKDLPQSHKVSPNARIDTWYGGDVAEILHIGAYADETPTIDRLKTYIEEQGYEISSDHEEEYLKGPGMLFKGNSKKYRTIIRYEVTRVVSK